MKIFTGTAKIFLGTVKIFTGAVDFERNPSFGTFL